jgi:hypothetical protein
MKWPPKDPTLPQLSNSAKPWDIYNTNKDDDNIFVSNSLLDNENKRRRKNNSNSGRKSNNSDIIIQQDEGGRFKYPQRKIRRDSEGYIVKDIAFEEKGYKYGENRVDSRELDSDGSIIYSNDEYSDDINDDEYRSENYKENFRSNKLDRDYYNEYVGDNEDYSEKIITNNYYKGQYQSQTYFNNNNGKDDEDNLPIGLMIAKKQLEAMKVKSNYHNSNDINDIVAHTINNNGTSNDDKKDN